MEFFEKISKLIKEKSQNKKIVCWGYNEEFLREIAKYGINIYKVFTANEDCINNKSALHPDFLKGNYNNYFVIFPNIGYFPGAIKQLKEWKYNDDDYLTFYPEKTIIITENEHYEDKFGNVINGFAKGAKIEIKGANNRILFGENIKVTDRLVIRVNSNDNFIKIGDKVKFRGDYLGDSGVLLSTYGLGSSVIDIGAGVSLMKSHINVGPKAEVHIGDNTTIEPDFMIQADAYTKVDIGKDCMFSSDVKIQSADGHSIFDVSNGENINSLLSERERYLRTVHIGDHVWVGRRDMIIGDTYVGNGCIIGAQSTVKGKFPNNVVLAGSLARIIATDRAWARMPMSEDMEDCKGFIKKTGSPKEPV